ncbi:MAG: DUF2905 family protein [Pseudomonadota bacterium]
MLKWLLTLALGVLLSGLLAPWLRRWGIGRLPGDLRLRGRHGPYIFPLASSLLLSALLGGVFLLF